MRAAACLGILVLAGCSAPATAPGDLRPADFAQGLAISAPPGSPFFRVELPEIVLTGTAWPDLRDLRVFNSESESVPFARTGPVAAKIETRRVSLQTFRVESLKPGSVPEVRLDTHERGVQLRVSPISTPEAGAEYLLALSDRSLDTPIDRLVLDWEPVETNWQQRVTIAVSNDLEDWRTIAFSRPLIDMKGRDGQRLQHREVSVDRVTPQSARYFRLRFGQGFSPKLTGVEAEVSPVAPPAPGVVLSVPPEVAKDGAITFTLQSAQPIARIRITPQDANSVLPILIEGRTAPDQPWRPITRTMVYRVNSTRGEEYSDPVSLGGQVFQAIRLRPVDTSWGSQPVVQIERDPITLVVNARGAGPFLLAWGSRAAEDTSVSYESLVPKVAADAPFDIASGQIGEYRTLGGPSRLTALAPAERAARWQTILVWVLLVAGAGGLSLLALRVWRESQIRT